MKFVQIFLHKGNIALCILQLHSIASDYAVCDGERRYTEGDDIQCHEMTPITETRESVFSQIAKNLSRTSTQSSGP